MAEAGALLTLGAQGFVFVLVAVVSYRALAELPFGKGPRALLAGAVAGLACQGVGEVLASEPVQLVTLPATALAFSVLVVLLLRLLERGERRRARNRTRRREEVPRQVRDLQALRRKQERD